MKLSTSPQRHHPTTSDAGTDTLPSAARVAPKAYHDRIEKHVPLFFSQYATKKPSLAIARDLSHDKRDYDAVRQDLGMCEWDFFTDVAIDAAAAKTTGQPLLRTQSSADRGSAATATIDQSRGEYIARLHQHVGGPMLHNTGINPDAADAAAQMNQVRQRQGAAGTDSARAFIENAQAQMVEHDSLTPILGQSRRAPQELVRELDEGSRCGRPSVEASDVKRVIVVDWDDEVAEHIVDPLHNEVGQQVDVAGIPTRVMRSMTYL